MTGKAIVNTIRSLKETQARDFSNSCCPWRIHVDVYFVVQRATVRFLFFCTIAALGRTVAKCTEPQLLWRRSRASRSSSYIATYQQWRELNGVTGSVGLRTSVCQNGRLPQSELALPYWMWGLQA